MPYIVVVIDIEPIRERFSAVAPFLDEPGRRLVAAAQAFAAGYGGIAAVAMATGVAPSTIGRGPKELAWDEPSERIRRPGAGRRGTVSKDRTLLHDLEALVEPRRRAPAGGGAASPGSRGQPPYFRRVISVHMLCLADCSTTTRESQHAEITKLFFGQILRAKA